jgi:hypothetical protein
MVDSTDVVNGINVIKSPEECALTRHVAAMQEETMQPVASHMKSGSKDFEVTTLLSTSLTTCAAN